MRGKLSIGWLELLFACQVNSRINHFLEGLLELLCCRLSRASLLPMLVGLGAIPPEGGWVEEKAFESLS